MTTTEFLQREIRRVELSIRRAERKPNTPPEELRGLHEKLEHLQEALEAVNEHWQRVHEQRGWTAGEPLTLTLEQLDEALNFSDGIGLHVLLRVDNVMGIRGVIDHREDDGICAVYSATGEWLKEKEYGKTWTAYAYPPAHIDLDKWTAEWVDNDQGEGMMCKCSKCGYPVSYFWGKTAFCPGCGRAMTPEAWAELERRCLG